MYFALKTKLLIDVCNYVLIIFSTARIHVLEMLLNNTCLYNAGHLKIGSQMFNRESLYSLYITDEPGFRNAIL